VQRNRELPSKERNGHLSKELLNSVPAGRGLLKGPLNKELVSNVPAGKGPANNGHPNKGPLNKELVNNVPVSNGRSGLRKEHNSKGHNGHSVRNKE
jgi:hypothetical protein